MSRSDASRFDPTQVLERFPQHAALIRRLLIADNSFLGICEDYALASATLARWETPEQDDQHVEKVADYRTLVADLERELAEVLQNAR